MPETKSFIVSVTGASGALYAVRTLRALLAAGHRVHLVMSRYGRYVLHHELDWAPDGEPFVDFLARTTGSEVGNGVLEEHPVHDLTRSIASGSDRVAGMVVVPCSARTLAAVAHGASSNLIERSADVMLKERRPLVLVLRETPLNLVHLRNMVAVTEAGATVLPAMPAFYQKPESFEDLGDFIAGRALSLLGLEHDLYAAWEGPPG